MPPVPNRRIIAVNPLHEGQQIRTLDALTVS
jgi:hypothetical protein